MPMLCKPNQIKESRKDCQRFYLSLIGRKHLSGLSGGLLIKIVQHFGIILSQKMMILNFINAVNFAMRHHSIIKAIGKTH